MIPLALMEWIAPRLYKLIGAGVMITMGVSACVYRDASIEKRGEVKAVTKIEKATDNAAQAGKRAAQRSTAPGVRVGVRDPYTRND
jgi:hypothetical protein